MKKDLPDLNKLDTTQNLSELVQKTSSHCPAEYVVEVKGEEFSSDVKVQDNVKVTGQDERHEENDSGECMNFGACATRTRADTTNRCGRQAIYNLVSSLLQHTLVIIHTYETSHPMVVASEVYHRCPITKDVQVLPIMHQLLVVLPQQNNGALWDCFEQTVMNILEHTISSKMESAIKLIDFTEYNAKNESETNGYARVKHTLCTTLESVEISDVSAVSTKNEFSANIGVCGKLTSHLGTSKFFLLNLDHLVMHKFGIDDIRLLWSEDPCQWKDLHYRKSPCSDSTVAQVEAASKFPPCYVHDLSFWVEKDVKFDELKFHSVVRRTAGLMLEDVQLIDSYKGDRTSLCYRFVYRSIDKALSKDQARYIQSLVREAVSKELSVELR